MTVIISCNIIRVKVSPATMSNTEYEYILERGVNMKIYISADIEGIGGVVDRSQLSHEGYDYTRARKLMTGEVNAAVRGARKSGAQEILINDSHGPMTNLLIEDLEQEARLITGNQKHLGMMQGIDQSFDAVILIGYHARHNTSGVLAHTYHGRVVSEICLNGSAVGEFEFNSLLAGYFNVPVVLVSGDDVLAGQVNTFNSEIETVVVKEAISRYTANCLHRNKIHELIESSIERVLANEQNNIEPCRLDGPVEIEMAFMNSGMAENAMLMPGVEMVSPNRVKYLAKDIFEAYKVRAVLIALGSK